MLTFMMLWTYMSFSQFLIIWAGNLKNEIPWYMARAFGGGRLIAAALLICSISSCHFSCLLQRGVKRRLRTLSASWRVDAGRLTLGGRLLAGGAVLSNQPARSFICWTFSPWSESAACGSARFLAQLKKLPLLPLHDPRFEGSAWSISMETKHPARARRQPVDASAGYEQRDANITGLLQFAFWMAVVLAVTLVAMNWTFNYFKQD